MESLEKLETILAAIAAKLNITAEKSFEILVQGNFAQGVANLVSLALGLIAVALTLRIGWELSEKIVGDMNELDRLEAKGIVMIPAATAAVILGLIIGGTVQTSVLALAAPEYLALKEIMDALK